MHVWLLYITGAQAVMLCTKDHCWSENGRTLRWAKCFNISTTWTLSSYPRRNNPEQTRRISYPIENSIRDLNEHNITRGISYSKQSCVLEHASFYAILNSYYIKPSLNNTPCKLHMSARLALSWVTAAMAQTCVCRHYKSAMTGWNKNCALITHWSFQWVTAKGDSTVSRPCHVTDGIGIVRVALRPAISQKKPHSSHKKLCFKNIILHFLYISVGSKMLIAACN